MDVLSTMLALLLIYSILKIVVLTKKKRNTDLPPEPCGAWPLIGHLRIFSSKIPICQTLGDLADKHGPVFSVWLGMRRTLVVSSWESVKECLQTNDRNFLNRPSLAAAKFLGYDSAVFSFSSYGPYWLEMRKLVTQELLSNRRVELLKHVRVAEVETGIKELYTTCCNDNSGSPVVDMSQWFSYVLTNNMVRQVAGKRYFGGFRTDKDSEAFGRAMREFFCLSGLLVMSDVIPFIEWMDLQGHVKSMKRVAKELDNFISSWLEEHIQSAKETAGKVKDELRDFMDVMLSSLSDGEDPIFGYKKETIIKGMALTLILGGTDSSSVTLTWALSLLLNHIEVLKRAQHEIDIHVGTKIWVEEADIKNLVYLQAIVKETLRLYPAAPLLVPHEAMEDCYVDGYLVPRGTQLLVNAWKLHRDSRVWENPCEFHPERFLTSHGSIDGRGQQFEYVPFSSGRRICPGITSALQMVNLTLARVLQGFNFSTPINAPVDMSEGLGLVMPKATPLQAVVTPRLEHEIYQV